MVGLWLPTGHCHQSSHVVHKRQKSCPDRAKARQRQQVRPLADCDHWVGVRSVAIEPAPLLRYRGARPRGTGCRGSMPALNGQAVPHQLQQGFWSGSQAGAELTGSREDSCHHGCRWP